MSDAVASPADRQFQLQEKVADLNAALREERSITKALKGDVERLTGELGAATKEVEGWKQKAAADPSEEVKALRAEIAQGKHRTAFDKAALAAGATREALDDLYQLSGLKPGDAPAKPEDFADYLTSAKGARKWAFGGATDDAGKDVAAEQGGSQDSLALPATEPPPGSGRGASDKSSGKFVVRASQLGDASWMRDNQAKVAEAQKAGSLSIQAG